MLSKLPKLKIHDEESFGRFRFRYYDKTTKKEKYKQVSYGRMYSKEEALAMIEEKRDEILVMLEKEYEVLRQKKKAW